VSSWSEPESAGAIVPDVKCTSGHLRGVMVRHVHRTNLILMYHVYLSWALLRNVVTSLWNALSREMAVNW